MRERERQKREPEKKRGREREGENIEKREKRREFLQQQSKSCCVHITICQRAFEVMSTGFLFPEVDAKSLGQECQCLTWSLLATTVLLKGSGHSANGEVVEREVPILSLHTLPKSSTRNIDIYSFIAR